MINALKRVLLFASIMQISTVAFGLGAEPGQACVRAQARMERALLNESVQNQFFSKEMIEHLSDEDVHNLIDVPALKKVEVGANGRPLCLDCTYIDIHASFLKSTEKFLRENNLFVGGKREFIKADARRMPFASNSIDRIISKNFPWLRKDLETKILIEDVLLEYKRVLSKDGSAILMFDSIRSERLAVVWERPWKIDARMLGKRKAEDEVDVLNFGFSMIASIAKGINLKVSRAFESESMIGIVVTH